MQSSSCDPTAANQHRLDEGIQFWAKLAATPSVAGQRPLFAFVSEFLGRLQQNLHFDHCAFSFYDSTRQVVAVVFESGEFRFPREVPVNQNSLGLVLQHQLAIEVADTQTDTRFPDLNVLAEAAGFRSFRVVPLSTHARRLGTLGVARWQPGSFSEDEVHKLDRAAQLVALVLENACITEVLVGEKKRLETLLDITTALMSSLDVLKLLQGISARLQPLVSQDFTHLALYDVGAAAMKHHVLDSTTGEVEQSTVPLGECPTGIAFTRGESIQFTETELQLMGSLFSQSLVDAGVRTISCFPLISRGRKLGALGLASTRNGHCSQADLVLLTQIAAQIAIAIDNARAHEEIARLKDRLAKEKLYLEDEIRSQHNFGEVVGNSPALRRVLKQVEIAAPSDATVLILGETGTGKELIARALHRLSGRRDNNFIKLNCAAIPTGLLESELFGHEKGAFTGAISQKIGRLELADKGTVFLDEIGEIPVELQPKLLRALQDQEFERLGGIRTIRVNVRVIAATNRDLGLAVENHQFRSDLYYRLNVFPIHLPSLRERPGDIPLLVRYFVQNLLAGWARILNQFRPSSSRSLRAGTGPVTFANWRISWSAP